LPALCALPADDRVRQHRVRDARPRLAGDARARPRPRAPPPDPAREPGARPSGRALRRPAPARRTRARARGRAEGPPPRRAVRRGRAVLGALEVSYPQHPHDEARAATAFVRAHELDVLRERDGRPSLAGKVTHINPAGAVVRVRVYAEDFGVLLTVDLPPERY